jgi:hypothetical protein
MRALSLIALSLLFAGADGGVPDGGRSQSPFSEVPETGLDRCAADDDCVWVSGSSDCCFPCGGRAMSKSAAEEKKQRCAGAQCPDIAYGCAAPPDTRYGVICRDGRCALRPRPRR